MYCKYCGKLIGNDVEEVCADCKVKFETPATNGDIKEGLKSGIIATVFSVVGLIFVAVAFAFIYVAIVGKISYTSSGINEPLPTEIANLFNIYEIISWITTPISIPLGIVGLILGVKCIKIFIKAKKQGRKKPIPALILGIFSTYTSACVLLFALASVILLFVNVILF